MLDQFYVTCTLPDRSSGNAIPITLFSGQVNPYLLLSRGVANFEICDAATVLGKCCESANHPTRYT